MAYHPVSRTRTAAVILACVGLALAASSMKAGAQGVPEPSTVTSADNPSDALSRHLRVLAVSPRNFQALIGAGQAALALGDTQSAAGFFGRADEVWPSSPLPHVGMGAATALDGDAAGALIHFNRAARLGGSGVTMGAHRGLAYDLLGRHSEAQADFRAALSGSDANEARRRLALSLAISGEKQEALNTLQPLLARRDTGAMRTRALVLALVGDQAGARQAIEWTMPGGWMQMGPFLGRLGSLGSGDKAAAVHLGIFPGAGYSAPTTTASAGTVQPNRLSEIEAAIQRQPVPAPVAPPVNNAPAPVVTFGTSSPGVASTAKTAVAAAGVTATQRKRFWVQLATAAAAEALPAQFQRIKARSDSLLDGLSGYVVEENGKARLLIGPFRDAKDARIFADDLASVSISAFGWTSAEGQFIRKISSE
jgi:Flp pilus assembly protein TadD